MCFFCKTEGEILEGETLENWIRDEIRILSVISEDQPGIFEEHYQYYLLDLEYLLSLGKITPEELTKLSSKENFSFGQK